MKRIGSLVVMIKTWRKRLARWRPKTNNYSKKLKTSKKKRRSRKGRIMRLFKTWRRK
jgi:hypothetical protein